MRSTRNHPALVAAAVLASCIGLVSPTRGADDGVVGSTASGSPAIRTSVTVNRPAAVIAGDVMVASVATSDEAVTVSAPDGWSLVRDDAIPGAVRQGVYLKRAGASEPPNYTWTLSDPGRVAGGITAYSGVAAADPVDAHGATLAPEGDSVLVAPELTTSVAGARIVLLTAVNSDGNLPVGPGLVKRWQITSRAASSGDPAGTGDPPAVDTGNDASDAAVVTSVADTIGGQAGPTPALTTTAVRPGPAISALLVLRPSGVPLPPDTVPPRTTIDAGPPATVTSDSATFVFAADEPASFTCALNDAGPATCSSPLAYTGLAEGPQRLTLSATDTAGNAELVPLTREWTVEKASRDAPALVGAGDIAACDSQGDEATAALVQKIPGTVFTLGDNAYVNGLAKEFAECYDPSWGRFKKRTMPAPGNHEYQRDKTAKGYYDYFGEAAGDPAKGYYDYTLGSWHVIVLNTECARVGGCGPGSPQERWLRRVLDQSKARCTVAITHFPRFSSAKAHGSTPAIEPLWQALYDYGADVVLSGHDHVYERFGPQKPNGRVDPLFGLRQFVVGTGGRDLRHFGNLVPNSEVRNRDAYGVLKLTLHRRSYDWEFVGEPGKSFTDSGTTACHGAPRPVKLLTPPPLPPAPIAPTVTPPPSTTTPTS